MNHSLVPVQSLRFYLKSNFEESRSSKTANFTIVEANVDVKPTSISRKIPVTEKLCCFHTVKLLRIGINCFNFEQYWEILADKQFSNHLIFKKVTLIQ